MCCVCILNVFPNVIFYIHRPVLNIILNYRAVILFLHTFKDLYLLLFEKAEQLRDKERFFQPVVSFPNACSCQGTRARPDESPQPLNSIRDYHIDGKFKGG